MRRLLTAVALVLALAASGCEDDDSGDNQGPEIAHIQGWVEPTRTNAPVEGATVYLIPGYDWYEPHFEAVDSVAAAADGFFSFDDVWSGHFQVYAGLRGLGGPSCFSHVSPFSSEFAAGDKRDLRLILFLHDVTMGSSANGVTVRYATDLPTPNARVRLWRMEGRKPVVVDSCLSAGDGTYRFEDMCSGNYIVSAQTDSVDEPGIKFSDRSRVFFCGNPTAVTVDTLRLFDYGVDKPAIYIYPEQAGRFDVRLDLREGARLTASEPEYGSGWNVFVAMDGRIDCKYDYLFYELSLPNAPSMPAGWCLASSDLDNGLAALLLRYGLIAREREEFLEYWLRRLPPRPFYGIYPVCDDDLAPWVGLTMSPAPDSVRRIWFVFRGFDRPQDLPAPVVPPFERRGTVVIEWGGMVLP